MSLRRASDAVETRVANLAVFQLYLAGFNVIQLDKNVT